MFTVGEFLPKGTATFTPWSPRQADNVIFYYYLVQPITGFEILTIQVYEKNLEDIGPGTQHGSASDDLSAGTTIKVRKVEGLKELVRLRLVVNDHQNALGVYYQILTPVWYNTAKVPSA